MQPAPESIGQLIADAIDALTYLPELKAKVQHGDTFYQDGRQRAIKAWKKLLWEIVKFARELPATPSDDLRPLAVEIVSALEAHAECRLARDRIGDRRQERTRSQLVTKLIGYATAIRTGLRRGG